VSPAIPLDSSREIILECHPVADYKCFSQNHRMVEKSEHAEVNRKDGDESFCPKKIDVDDVTVENCTLWAAEGPN